HAELPGRDELEVLAQVAPRRPAHERGRIVETPLLVVRIEEPGSPGPAHAEDELLLEEELAGQVESHQTRDDDAPALAGDLGGRLDGLVARGRREDQDGVGALAAGEGPDRGQELRGRGGRAG